MSSTTDNTESAELKSQPDQKKEIRLFIYVMVAFTLGMVLLLIFDVSTWWIWYLYLAIWTLVELKIAKNIKLKWWVWVLIIAAILALDWVVLEVIDLIKK